MHKIIQHDKPDTNPTQSTTIPCTACVRQNKAAECQRELVAVVTRRSTARSRASTSYAQSSSPTRTNTITTEVSSTPIDETTSTVTHSLSTTVTDGNNDLPQIDDRIIEQLLASISSPESRLTNEAAATLEFLTHGRRNILNRFIGRDMVPATAATAQTTLNHKWDTFFPVEDARAILDLHQRHLAWMHNVVHMPTFIAEFEENVLRVDCDKSWIALYYALLSQTLHHIDGSYLATLPQRTIIDDKLARVLFDKSIDTLYQAGFMDNHKLTSVQTICLLVQVAHNFDKSDLICVLVSTTIRIAQCLNLHRLGPDPPVNPASATAENPQEVINREVRKRVWWFLVRYDWLQIPFQNTCQIHLSQFNTPMPANCHDDVDRMVKDGITNPQPSEIYTITTWTNCLHQLSILMWKHQDRMSQATNFDAGSNADNISTRYEEAMRADSEIKGLYSSWPQLLQDTNAVPNDHLSTNELPSALMPAMLLISTAQKIFTVHRQFQLSCFRDRRFAFSQLSCVAIAERSIEAFQKWPDCLETRICRRMWTTLTYVISCCITLLFALLFKAQNTLTHDFDRIRSYVEFGKDFISKEEHISSIARRGFRLLSALMDLERSSEFSVDIEADIGDTIHRVALAEEDGVGVNPAESYQIVFPYGQDLWQSLMGVSLSDDLLHTSHQ
ncbi:hypothetical protein NM208_g6046 [Fusarium decemcellulare]|uniref:Uncharacterized protein n=1 Tax=Fusarium decemcellulare TaxID=57161 RepID=A0ACC1SEU4_9HYPO|nr:hypothetical protein NM208_g6046 [Fusarium decemcellulare]